ncbi:winged helix-turn-helix domain-containing protein [Streptomyces smyrnaeus]|uniref:winged helix-turn-helix domain-containing protein n=1 Tax=Streptomyces smyrnaeus TaxID=1387713 RepID=UPI00369D440E
MKGARHPRHRLEPLLQSPVRFSVMAALASAERLEFRFVRDAVEINDSALSKQSTALEEAGLVEVEKGYLGKRPRTWLKATPKGREVFQEHCAGLQAIARGLAVDPPAEVLDRPTGPEG